DSRNVLGFSRKRRDGDLPPARSLRSHGRGEGLTPAAASVPRRRPARRYRSLSRVCPPACFFRLLPNSEGERSRSSLRREDTTDFRRWPLRAEVSSGAAEEVGLGS